VLIALTLLAMMVAATVAALRTFGNTKATLESITQRVDEIRSVSNFLRDSLAEAMPLTRGEWFEGEFSEEQAGSVLFGGDSDRIVWVAPLVAGAGYGGATIMDLSRSEDALQLRWAPYNIAPEALEEGLGDSRILLHDVQEFEVGYLEYHGEDWVDSWPEAATSPYAVRLSIKAGGKYWPELVIRINHAQAP
jgi:general secretion pathway protein J